MTIILLKEHYTQVPNASFHSKILTTHEKMVYHSLLTFCFGEKLLCYPTQKTLAEYASCSEAQVKKVLKKLEQYGLIKIINKGCKKANNYKITDIYNYNQMKDFETHVDNYIKNNMPTVSFEVGVNKNDDIDIEDSKTHIDTQIRNKDIPAIPFDEGLDDIPLQEADW